jgi:hypothetical protein
MGEREQAGAASPKTKSFADFLALSPPLGGGRHRALR